MLIVRSYQITITMADGSQGVHFGLYEDGMAAVTFALDAFPEAVRISARRVS